MALVLKRYSSQVVCIGDDIRITVFDIRKGSVRMRIEAPPGVAVHREEIRDDLRRTGRQFIDGYDPQSAAEEGVG